MAAPAARAQRALVEAVDLAHDLVDGERLERLLRAPGGLKTTSRDVERPRRARATPRRRAGSPSAGRSTAASGGARGGPCAAPRRGRRARRASSRARASGASTARPRRRRSSRRTWSSSRAWRRARRPPTATVGRAAMTRASARRARRNVAANGRGRRSPSRVSRRRDPGRVVRGDLARVRPAGQRGRRTTPAAPAPPTSAGPPVPRDDRAPAHRHGPARTAVAIAVAERSPSPRPDAAPAARSRRARYARDACRSAATRRCSSGSLAMNSATLQLGRGGRVADARARRCTSRGCSGSGPAIVLAAGRARRAARRAAHGPRRAACRCSPAASRPGSRAACSRRSAAPTAGAARCSAGLILVGTANATALLARTAAGDMYPPERRARGIALVLFGSVFGAILGPAVFSPLLAGRDARRRRARARCGSPRAAFMVVGARDRPLRAARPEARSRGAARARATATTPPSDGRRPPAAPRCASCCAAPASSPRCSPRRRASPSWSRS